MILLLKNMCIVCPIYLCPQRCLMDPFSPSSLAMQKTILTISKYLMSECHETDVIKEILSPWFSISIPIVIVLSPWSLLRAVIIKCQKCLYC